MSLSKLFCETARGLPAKRERRKEARPGEMLAAAMEQARSIDFDPVQEGA